MLNADSDLIRRIAISYGRTPALIHPSQSGYRNSSYRLDLADQSSANLIIYKREPHILPRIQLANRLGAHLNDTGIPTRHLIDPRITSIAGPTGTRYAALYNYLPGHTIPWEAYTRSYIKLMGAALSHIHETLKAAKVTAPPVADEYAGIFRRMQHYFTRSEVQAAMSHKLGLAISPQAIASAQRLIHASRQFPGQQSLHMDFVRSNVLFGSTLDHPVARFQLGGIAITGVIDLEKASHGHPLFDIARTMAFLLVDCKHKTPRQVRKYFLDSGYNKRGEAAYRHEWDRLLERLIDLFLLHDFYKFLRHNPYEDLARNEHFVRTRDILIERHLVLSLAVRVSAVTGDQQ